MVLFTKLFSTNEFWVLLHGNRVVFCKDETVECSSVVLCVSFVCVGFSGVFLFFLLFPGFFFKFISFVAFPGFLLSLGTLK